MINGECPTQARIYVNQDGIIEALILNYDVNNREVFTSHLDRKCIKTFETTTFYGSYEGEYRNNNRLIRIIKPFCRGTEFIYGTINWFEKFDACCNQLDKLKEKRRNYAIERKDAERDGCNRRFKRHRENPWRMLLKEFDMFDDHNEMFDFPEFSRHELGCNSRNQLFDFENNDFGMPEFRMPFDNVKSKRNRRNHKQKQLQKKYNRNKNSDVTFYRTSRSYSKVGDVEEWIYDDNGKITKIRKTPDGTEVIHDGENSIPQRTSDKRQRKKVAHRQKPAKHFYEIPEDNLKLCDPCDEDVNL